MRISHSKVCPRQKSDSLMSVTTGVCERTHAAFEAAYHIEQKGPLNGHVVDQFLLMSVRFAQKKGLVAGASFPFLLCQAHSSVPFLDFLYWLLILPLGA